MWKLFIFAVFVMYAKYLPVCMSAHAWRMTSVKCLNYNILGNETFYCSVIFLLIYVVKLCAIFNLLDCHHINLCNIWFYIIDKLLCIFLIHPTVCVRKAQTWVHPETSWFFSNTRCSCRQCGLLNYNFNFRHEICHEILLQVKYFLPKMVMWSGFWA